MAFAPLLIGLAGTAATVGQGVQQQQATQYNAATMANEGKAAVDQSNAQANQVLRQGRAAVGREAAAFGGAGVGYGGSSLTSMDQSAVNNELDALNTRYKGSFSAYGYNTQSSILRSQAGQEGTATALLAGGQALKAIAGNYAPASAVPSAGAGS
jgi:hypothetical protein